MMEHGSSRSRSPGGRRRWGLLAATVIVAGVAFVASSAILATFEDVNPDQSSLDPADPDGASGGRVNGLASVAGDNQTFYAASEWGGLYKSTDGGLTWGRLDGHLPVATWDVEVDPADTDTVYATSFYDGRVDSLAGIEVSYDAGTTWTHPGTATPPASYNCATDRREEPSAFGIGIRPDASQNVFIGTNCGVAISGDSGSTWSFVDPTPATPASNVWDVVVQPGGPTNQGIVDICGDDGNFRSTDGGATWVGGGLPGGQCSIAASPDESYVLFAVVGTTLRESDDAGATWTVLPNPRSQGRIPFFETNQRSDSGGVNRFDLWFGDVSLYRRSCTTPTPPAQGGAVRCPSAPNGTNGVDDDGDGAIDEADETWLGPFTRSVGAHDDAGAIVFDTQAANDACPEIFSSDGGVFYNTDNGADCQNPNWEQPNVTPHALWLFTMDGVDLPGDDAEGLYFGCQDNGTFGTTTAGAASVPWTNRDCCDSFDMAADANRVLYTDCCYGARSNRLWLRAAGLGAGGEVNTYPADGLLPGFRPPDILDRFGDGQYVILTLNCTPLATAFNGIDDDNDGMIDEADENNGCSNVNGGDGGMYITNDITANPIVWTELGNATEDAPTGPGSGSWCAVKASVPASNVPTFFVQSGNCDGASQDQLWAFTGTDPNGTWTRLDTNLASGGIGIFDVDPLDPMSLYASNLTPTGPQMVFSNDGGATWQNDTALDQLMTGGGFFKYQTQRGPTDFTGFNGYPQPSLVAFDPDDPDLIVAGGRDSGVFLSRDAGASWTLLTDPFTSDTSGIPNIPRPWFAHFDHEPGKLSIFIGTQGRGVWRLQVPVDKPQIQVPGSVVAPDTCVGSSGVATLNVCNTGNLNLEVEPITSSDPNFAVTIPSSGYPVVISPDFCFPFEVQFTPGTAGVKAGFFTITSNDPVSPVLQVEVSGTALEPDIDTVIADAGSFGDVCREEHDDLDLTIANSGGCPLTVTSITSSSGDFFEPGVMTYPFVVGPGTSTHVPIRFAPTTLGMKSGTITVNSDDPDTPAKDVAVSGNVPPGDIRVTGSTDFGDVCAEELAEKTVSVCNVGECNLNVASVAVDCPDFTLINNPFPAPVSPDSCLDVVVRFTPTSAGPKTCNLTILSDDPDMPVVVKTLTGNTPIPMIDVPPDQAFPATVIQGVGACSSLRPFPVSNTGQCNLGITDLSISIDPDEYSLSGLPSFPIILEPGHVAGEGDLRTVFEPDVLDRDIAGEVSVTYVSDPITGTTTTVTRDLCGEGVKTGVRVLVERGGVPVPTGEVFQIQLQRVTGNRKRKGLISIDNVKNPPLTTVTPALPCQPFQYHAEFGTVANDVQLLPGFYNVTATARVNGKRKKKTAGFDLLTCDFNRNVVIDF